KHVYRATAYKQVRYGCGLIVRENTRLRPRGGADTSLNEVTCDCCTRGGSSGLQEPFLGIPHLCGGVEVARFGVEHVFPVCGAEPEGGVGLVFWGEGDRLGNH